MFVIQTFSVKKISYYFSLLVQTSEQFQKRGKKCNLELMAAFRAATSKNSLRARGEADSGTALT